MPIPFDSSLAWSLLAALLIGALVGIEREKSKAASGNVGIGGVRTFTMFALVGALGGLLDFRSEQLDPRECRRQIVEGFFVGGAAKQVARVPH